MSGEIAVDNGVARNVAVGNGEPAEGVNRVVDLEQEDMERGDDAANSVDPRMELTEHERNLAINIKEAIASTPEVDPVSDFMCAQLALIDGDNVEGAIGRVHHLQCFREEYGILDTTEDGIKCFMDHVALFPEAHLCFSYVPERGNYVMIYDINKVCHHEICSEERQRAFLGGHYYTCLVLCPDLEAIRSGCILIMECDGYDWKTDIDFKLIKKVWTEAVSAYPFRLEKIKYFHSSNTVNIVASLLKPFLPRYLHERLEFGCQNEQRLDELYMVPTVEAANLRLLARFNETLALRYKNERTFRL